MRCWAFNVFKFYLKRLNDESVPIDKKINMMDFHHWVEHRRMDEFADEIYLSSDIEAWKSRYKMYYELDWVFHSL